MSYTYWLEFFIDENPDHSLADKDCRYCEGSGREYEYAGDPQSMPVYWQVCGCVYSRVAYVEYYEHPEAGGDYDVNPYEAGTQEYIDWIPF